MDTWAFIFFVITLALLIPIAYVAFSPPDVAKLKAQGDIAGLLKALHYSGLTSEAADVRKSAALALGQLGAPVAVEPLIATMNDPEEEKSVRKAAAIALGHLRDGRAVVPLVLASSEESLGDAIIPPLKELGPVAAQALTLAVKDGSAEVRQKTVTALHKIGEKWTIQPLLQALDDPDEAIRTEAVEGLTQLGIAAVGPLSNVLDYALPLTRQLAAKILGEIGDSSAAYILFQNLQDEHSEVRRAVAEALDKLQWRPASEYDQIAYWIAKQQWDQCRKVGGVAAEPLLTVLVKSVTSDHNEDQIQQTIIKTLIQIKTPAVVYLIDALDNAPSPARRVIAQILGQVGDQRAVGPLVNLLEVEKGEVRLAIVKALDQLHWEPDRRKTGAIYWVAKQEWQRCIEIGQPAEEPLIELIKDETEGPDLRQMAALTLQQLGTPTSVDVLARYWIASRQWSKCVDLGSAAIEPLVAALVNPEIRDDVIDTLGKIGNPVAITPLLDLAAEDMTIKTQESITNALVTIGAIDRLGVLIEDILDPPPERVRKVIIAALGLIGNGKAVDSLILAFQRSGVSETDVRHAAVVALGQIADPKAVNLLVYVVQDTRERWSIRQSAIEALGDIGDPRAVAALNKLLTNWLELGRIRQAAAEALGKIGHKSAIGALIDALKDNGQGIADTAAESLAAITGQNFGLDEARWREWWRLQVIKGNL